MAKIKILVAEDDPIHAMKMEMLLDEMNYQLMGICSATDEMLRSYKAIKPDLVLLDIELDNGSDGIEIANRINAERRVPIIFVSARNDVATMMRANESNPYAYMVKPVEKSGLQAAIELALYKFARDQEESIKSEPFTGWSDDLLVKDSFFIKTGSQLEKVRTSDILWIALAEERYCEIFTDSRQYHIRTSISSLTNKLDTNIFVRIHRKHIVNADRLDAINEADMTVTVGGHLLSIGKTYKNILLKRLNMLQ
ncbi:MAG: response regulator transcription factor [Cyclobacteriaceae bacterium]